MTDLSICRLYGILDLGYVDALEAAGVVSAMIEGGVDLIQLRAKEHTRQTIASLATKLHEVTSKAGVPLIINDDAETARVAGAEGVHIGQDDGAIAQAREIVGRDCIIGRSTHNVAQARQAAAEGANYIGFGPLFATPTKPTYVPIGLGDVPVVHAELTIPIFCIGGIKLRNLPEVIAAGARRVVIVSGLLQAPDIAEYARFAKALLNSKSTMENQK